MICSETLPAVRNFVLIVSVFIVCYGITALFLGPIQRFFISEAVFNGYLVYLPHGVSVLATMLFGWKAFLPLLVGHFGGRYFFPSEHLVETVALPVILTAACSFFAFEAFRRCGKDCYANEACDTHWRAVFAVGVLASLIGAFGQSLLLPAPGSVRDNTTQYAFVAAGNIWGLFVFLFVLMFLFRWARLYGGRGRKDPS